MFRQVSAIVAGIVIAIALVAIAEIAAHFIYPPPSDLDLANTAAVRAWVATLPFGAFALVLMGWALGALLGVSSAVLIAGRRPVAGWFVALVFLTAALFNLVTLPSPTWFKIAGVLLVVSGPMIAMLALSRTASADPPLAQA